MFITQFNPLTVVPESHTGNDHALYDLFRVYFSAKENSSQQTTRYYLFRNMS